MVVADPVSNTIVYENTSSFSNLSIKHENIKHFASNNICLTFNIGRILRT